VIGSDFTEINIGPGSNVSIQGDNLGRIVIVGDNSTVTIIGDNHGIVEIRGISRIKISGRHDGTIIVKGNKPDLIEIGSTGTGKIIFTD